MFQYNAREYQNGMRQILRNLKGNCFLTFNFNAEVSHVLAQRKMGDFFNKLQREVFGSRWNKQFNREWPTFVGFRERCEQYRKGRAGWPHYHGVGRFDDAFLMGALRDGPLLWKDIVPGGQLWPERAENKEGVLRYSTKRMWNDEACESIFMYCDERKGAQRGLTARLPK